MWNVGAEAEILDGVFLHSQPWRGLEPSTGAGLPGFESHPLLLCDLMEVVQPLWASVFSFVKWRC